MRPVLTKTVVKLIADRIRSLKLVGFGGYCLSAARTINSKVFRGDGIIVAAANDFWLKRGRFLGHVAVKVGNTYWDADAHPKTWEDIEAWGMLDEDDSDYATSGWNTKAAYKVARLYGEEEVQAAFEAWQAMP